MERHRESPAANELRVKKASPLMSASSSSDSTSIFSSDSMGEIKPANDTTSTTSSSADFAPTSTKGKLQSQIRAKKVFVRKKKPKEQKPVKNYYGMFDPLRKKKREFESFWLTSQGQVGVVCVPAVVDAAPSPHEIVLKDDVSLAMNAFLNKREIPSPELLPKVLELMKSECVKAIIDEDYDYAEQLENGRHRLRQHRQWSRNVIRASETEKAIEEKIERAKVELKAENDEWAKVLSEFKMVQGQQRKTMLDDHVREQREYEEKWNDPAMLIPFSKPSPQLLQLRKQQKKMALAKRFSEAKEIKQIADKMQLAEGKEAEKKAMATIKAGFDVIVERQKREIECFDEHERRSLAYIEQERKKATEPIEKQIRALELAKQQESDKHVATARKSVVRKLEENRGRGVVTVAAPNPVSKQLMDYRRADEPLRLNLNTMNMKRYVANRRVASSCRIGRVENAAAP